MSNKHIPAFPYAFPDKFEDDYNVCYGMTLRDYFAAKAMQAILSDPDVTDIAKTKLWISITSYAMADAMLKEREA